LQGVTAHLLQTAAKEQTLSRRKNRVKKIALLLILFFVGIPCLEVSGAQKPLEAVQGPIDKIISILNDPAYRDGAQKVIGREKIWAVVQEFFDFTEMAKRTLAQNWPNFAPPQRKEFSLVFGEFLGNTYMNKIQKGYRDEKVVYLGEEMVSDGKAVVKTKIVRENVETPVDYSMMMQEGGWTVYDVRIEGVSLVKNYRTQFEKILMKSSPQELIERLKTKIEKQKQGEEVSDEAALEGPKKACLPA
jgi:phospholipid transport system substrate-binding protein